MGWLKKQWSDIEDSAKKYTQQLVDQTLEVFGQKTSEDRRREARQLAQEQRAQQEQQAQQELATELATGRRRDRRAATLLTQRQPFTSGGTLLTAIELDRPRLGGAGAFGAAGPLSTRGPLGG